MNGTVTSLNGGPVGVLAPNEDAIELLEDMLERAKSGDIVGVAVCALHYDAAASYSVAGLVGGYSLLGALEMAKAELIEGNQD